MITLLITLSSIFAYILIGSLNYSYCKFHKIGAEYSKYYHEWDYMGTILASVFWPVGIWYTISVNLIKKFDKLIEQKEQKKELKLLRIEKEKKELQIAMRELDRELKVK